jgi:1,2-diacylglycerol 3-alpha-glucosyltransferase
VRILMISDVYFPRVNGVSTSIQTFRREFQALGHQVMLIAPSYGDDRPDEAIIRVPSRVLIVDREDRMMKITRVTRLEERLHQQDFDLVHVQTPFVAHHTGLRLSRRLGLRRVETYHTFFEEYLQYYAPVVPKRWLRFAARRLSSWQCNRMDAVIVPSEAMLAHLRGYGVNTPGTIIPTGIRLEDFDGCDRQSFRRVYGIAPDRRVMLFVGRVAFEKNVEFLLHVAKRVLEKIPDALLVIAGEGPAERSSHRRARELGVGDHVMFVGYLSREDALMECYRAADVFVFASRTETQGLVLLEAMALGVPVVSTAVMGTRDVLKAGQGGIVAEEDEDDFARKVVRVLSDGELQCRLREGGLEYVKQWSSGACAARMIDFYSEVINSRTGLAD